MQMLVASIVSFWFSITKGTGTLVDLVDVLLLKQKKRNHSIDEHLYKFLRLATSATSWASSAPRTPPSFPPHVLQRRNQKDIDIISTDKATLHYDISLGFVFSDPRIITTLKGDRSAMRYSAHTLANNSTPSFCLLLISMMPSSLGG